MLFVYNSQAMESRTARFAELVDEVESRCRIDVQTIEKIGSVWEKDKKVLMYLTSHENILKVDECVEMARECAEVENTGRALYLLKLARHYTEDLKEREKISLDNIF